MTDEKLLKTAVQLVKAMDKGADEMLPKEIVDIVKLHSKLAVGSAWIPVPGADVAAGAANIWGMYVRINNRIGLPFKENAIKSIGSGVATNLASYIAVSGIASGLKFIPGIGSVAGALLISASLYAVTITSGWIYLQALSQLAQRSGPEINMDKLGDAVKSVLSEKGLIKNFISEAKKEYK